MGLWDLLCDNYETMGPEIRLWDHGGAVVGPLWDHYGTVVGLSDQCGASMLLDYGAFLDDTTTM